MGREDTIAEDVLEPYANEQLEDLSDDQLLAIRDSVAAILSARAELCRRLLDKVDPPRPKRTRAKKEK